MERQLLAEHAAGDSLIAADAADVDTRDIAGVQRRRRE